MLKKRGFTLVELLIAIIIFSAVILGGFGILRLGIAHVDNARHVTRASQIMQSEIEEIRSKPWSDIVALTGPEQEVPVGSQFAEPSYIPYQLKRTVSGVGNSRKITLIISWSDVAGRFHEKVSATQYAKNGIYDYID